MNDEERDVFMEKTTAVISGAALFFSITCLVIVFFVSMYQPRTSADRIMVNYGLAPNVDDWSKEDRVSVSHDQTKVFVKSGALIENSNMKVRCSLTVLAKDYGVTSGHCAETGDVMTVIDSGGRANVLGKVIHDPRGIESRSGDDVAVIRFAPYIDGDPIPMAKDPGAGERLFSYGARTGVSYGHAMTGPRLTISGEGLTTKYKPIVIADTDFLIQHGDSGGPVVNGEGRLVGLATSEFPTGYSRITPSSVVRAVVSDSGITPPDFEK